MAKDLIIVRAGRNSLHPTWLDTTTRRSWDLMVCPYEELPPQPEGVLVTDVVVGQLFTGWQVFASQQVWSRFFERCAWLGAKLAQPALLEASYFSHSVTVRNTEFTARRVSFVESNAPCFRNDVFAEMIATFDLTANGWGWGLEFLWSKKLGYKDLFRNR